MTKSLGTRLLTAAVALSPLARKVGLDTPDGAQLACTSNADCPSSWRCNANRQRCHLAVPSRRAGSIELRRREAGA